MIVDDEPLFSRAVVDYLADLGLETIQVDSRGAAIAIARERLVDVVLLDQRLPDGLGAEICPLLVDANERCKIVFVTAFPEFSNVIAALRGGAFDYLVKPCEPEALRLVVERCLRVLDLEGSQSAHDRNREQSAQESAPYFGGQLAETKRLIELASRVDAPVLLTGETGTGKSMVARAIHFMSERRGGEFVAVNCAALPESLVEAELFGYERGTFTGSTGAREGLFEMADGGSIFLDEITELPLHLQARLLHVVEDQIVRRLGGRSFRKVSFRLMTATNSEPEKALAEHRLREDLYHRISVLAIRMPAVRDRLDDLPDLIERLLRNLCPGSAPRCLADGEAERLARYDWPGNVRELRNVLERSALLSTGGPLRPSDFLGPSRPGAPEVAAHVVEVERGEPANSDTLEAVERRHIYGTLERCGGNVALAARTLGISRSTLRRKLTSGGSK